MKTKSLSGLWMLTESGKSAGIEANVPGDVYMDLLRTGIIPDPYYRDNENRVQWVGETGWTYSREFRISPSFLSQDRILLRCGGLDTLATVSLNGDTIAKTDNMFRQWEFDVKDKLVKGSNRIEVSFDSAAAYSRKMMEQRRLPQWDQPMGNAYLRKEPCNFGWDWGPRLVTAGIWRDIGLVAYDTARIDDVHILQQHRRNAVVLKIDATVETARPSKLLIRAAVGHRGQVVTAEKVVKGNRARLPVTIENPALWWPNGMGKQPLYTVKVELLDAEGNRLDVQRRRIGLRTLRLDRHKDRWGESFQFKINGVPFFAKGANWIPADAVLSHMTRDRYRQLIDDCVASNMNMLRVWGGGVYEDDAFYQFCDEKGICIWQDFMFACAAYPAFDPAFLKNVRAEAEDNVRRLRHHPCIALWCGNNEMEAGLVGDEWSETTMSWKDYSKLFDKLLPEVVSELDPQTDYWPSSPHTPVGDRMKSYLPTSGDAHLWGVWHGQRPFEWFRNCRHRFNSEFGFQSFPEPKTVHSYTTEADRNVTTHIMEHHQRSGIGNTTIMRYMLDWFRLPTAFDMTLWLSQILQGMAIKYACEHWRRSMPRGMGTLYWQLNDCWPVASWASIDAFGRWKALHYMARAFYAPILVSGLEDTESGTVQIHVTSDLMESKRGQMAWTLTDVLGEVIDRGSRQVEIAPRKSKRIETLRFKKIIEERGIRDLILWIDLTVGRKRVSTNLVTFARPKHLELQAPGITPRVRKMRNGSYRVSLSAKKPALWTWLELDGMDAQFSNNFFHLRPGDPAEIAVQPADSLNLKELRSRLIVRSLIDTYR